MATKLTKKRRAAPRKRRKPAPSDTPKRHAWTRRDGEIHRPGYKIGYARVSTLDQMSSSWSQRRAYGGPEARGLISALPR